MKIKYVEGKPFRRWVGETLEDIKVGDTFEISEEEYKHYINRRQYEIIDDNKKKNKKIKGD